ncbi:hypothetical protein PAPYR_6476 [Paratrimastix pyriformis]|uniref:GPR1/FUN34/yaaH family protein n=1 Tax=Paratrimastix pyriformis TaxID=342808 RepID=A0ABQ8UF80_9EUKA|nr:hypothetical protein PAPYR_6476 [Paratrimastix pyriformis]
MSEHEHPVKKAAAGPLGLIAFGMTTTLLNLKNLGLFKLSSMVYGMGVFYGGLVQLIVGILEFKEGNTFGWVAFSSYGCFWLSLCFTWILSNVGLAPADSTGMMFYLIMWGTFTLFLWFCTFRSNLCTFIVFGSLVVLFYFLALADLLKAAGTATGGEWVERIAGLVGVVCGLTALYTGLAEVLNENLGRVVMPLGKPFRSGPVFRAAAAPSAAVEVGFIPEYVSTRSSPTSTSFQASETVPLRRNEATAAIPTSTSLPAPTTAALTAAPALSAQ